MKSTNWLGNFFDKASDLLNGAERAFLDLLSVAVPYAVPIIPAYLTYFHTRDMMQFPDWVAKTAAFVVEVLGITAVSTAVRFWRHNQRYKDTKNHAPFWLAVGVYVFYIVIVLSVNVILEIVADTRSGWVILSIGLFSLLSFPSGVLISIRAQYREMLEERAQKHTPQPAIAYASTTLQVHRDWRTLSTDERREIVHVLSVEEIMHKYGIARSTAFAWKSKKV